MKRSTHVKKNLVSAADRRHPPSSEHASSAGRLEDSSQEELPLASRSETTKETE